MRIDRSLIRTGAAIAAGAALGLLAPLLPALGSQSPPVSCESRFQTIPASLSEARALVGQLSLPVGVESHLVGLESHLVGLESHLVGLESRLVGVASQVCSVLSALPELPEFPVTTIDLPDDDFPVPPTDVPDDDFPVPPIDDADDFPVPPIDDLLADSFDLPFGFPDSVDLGTGDQLDALVAAALEAAAESTPPQVTEESEPPQQVTEETGPPQQETGASESAGSTAPQPTSPPALPAPHDLNWSQVLAAWYSAVDAKRN